MRRCSIGVATSWLSQRSHGPVGWCITPSVTWLAVTSRTMPETYRRPEPTAVPTEIPSLGPATQVEVRRGDLVGPGAGVVEPVLVSAPRVVYPPIAKQQHVEGRVVVLVLVDENGNVTESRLQQGTAQSNVNNAVLAGVKSAKFRPATKNGLAVKMWRPLIVEVKP